MRYHFINWKWLLCFVVILSNIYICSPVCCPGLSVWPEVSCWSSQHLPVAALCLPMPQPGCLVMGSLFHTILSLLNVLNIPFLSFSRTTTPSQPCHPPCRSISIRFFGGGRPMCFAVPCLVWCSGHRLSHAGMLHVVVCLWRLHAEHLAPVHKLPLCAYVWYI